VLHSSFHCETHKRKTLHGREVLNQQSEKKNSKDEIDKGNDSRAKETQVGV